MTPAVADLGVMFSGENAKDLRMEGDARTFCVDSLLNWNLKHSGIKSG